MDANKTVNEDKINVLLLFGGESTEHEVSVISARNVLQAIDKERFSVALGYIDEQGRWWLAHDISNKKPETNEEIMARLGSRMFKTEPAGHILECDVLLPILHGKNGEDGSVQALGQLLHIPVVGCDMTSSAICMDKVATKNILSANNLPVVPYKTHRRGEAEPDFMAITQELGLPLFVKPARSGSSVGVSKVTERTQFTEAIRLAHEHDDVALIEQSVEGRELEVAAIGRPPHHDVSGVGEIIAGEEFYSYEAKYSSDSTSEAIIPAALDKSVSERIRLLAKRAYNVLGCQGMARIDFFLDHTGKAFINEVNTIPGFTDISMYPKLWQHEGVSYSDLIARLIYEALGDTIQSE